MSIQVNKLGRGDDSLVEFIINDLMGPDNGKPSAGHIHNLLADDRTYLYAAQFEKSVAGYALAYKFPSLYSSGYLAYLYDIEVLQQYRRKGVGLLLMETLKRDLKQAGVHELFLGTATDNVEGQAFFTAAGGIKSGETFNDFTWEFTTV